MFTEIYNHLLANGYTTKDPFVYSVNLRWILGVACVGFVFLLFVGTNIRDRLLPRTKGEWFRIRVFDRLTRVALFGVRPLSQAEEDAEWESFVDRGRKEAHANASGTTLIGGS